MKDYKLFGENFEFTLQFVKEEIERSYKTRETDSLKKLLEFFKQKPLQ